MPAGVAGVSFAFRLAARGAPKTTAIEQATVTRTKVMMFSLEKICFMGVNGPEEIRTTV